MALSPQTAAHDPRVQLETLWKRNIPVLNGRLDLLSSAAAATQHGTLSEPLLAEAIAVAHKLAGSLGMFGYPEGTQLARRLEEAFAAPTPEPGLLMHLADQLRAALHRAVR